MSVTKGLVMAGVLGLSTMAGSSAWAINKCVDARGRTSFQDEPCAGDQKAQDYTMTPPNSGVNPTAGRQPVQTSPSAAAPAPAAPVNERPADCPSAQEMQKLQVQAESVALPLPIRNQLKSDFQALQQRCD